MSINIKAIARRVGEAYPEVVVEVGPEPKPEYARFRRPGVPAWAKLTPTDLTWFNGERVGGVCAGAQVESDILTLLPALGIADQTHGAGAYPEKAEVRPDELRVALIEAIAQRAKDAFPSAVSERYRNGLSLCLGQRELLVSIGVLPGQPHLRGDAVLFPLTVRWEDTEKNVHIRCVDLDAASRLVLKLLADFEYEELCRTREGEKPQIDREAAAERLRDERQKLEQAGWVVLGWTYSMRTRTAEWRVRGRNEGE